MVPAPQRGPTGPARRAVDQRQHFGGAGALSRGELTRSKNADDSTDRAFYTAERKLIIRATSKETILLSLARGVFFSWLKQFTGG